MSKNKLMKVSRFVKIKLSKLQIILINLFKFSKYLVKTKVVEMIFEHKMNI
jgi:hypothetical protein